MTNIIEKEFNITISNNYLDKSIMINLIYLMFDKNVFSIEDLKY